VGHFLLTTLLLDVIKASAPARIVILSSLAYMSGTIPYESFNFHQILVTKF
jgi:hypothetical protein